MQTGDMTDDRAEQGRPPGDLRDTWERQDPTPDDLVARLQTAAAAAASDLDVELMLLVEQASELVGARGSTSYTLRFAHGGVDLLLRVSVDGSRSRVDGWVTPPEPMTVRALPGEELSALSGSSPRPGASSSPTCRSGCCDCSSSPDDSTRPAFVTPTFEI